MRRLDGVRIVLVAIVGLVGLIGGGCARSAANMAATQPESRDLSVLVKGVPRDKIVARLGAPETTTQHGEITAEVFKFVQGYSGGARTARVFAHSTLSIATFGLWEVAGTAIEGYARGNTISVRCVYDKHRLLETYEFLEGEEYVDEQVLAGAKRSLPAPPSSNRSASAIGQERADREVSAIATANVYRAGAAD